MPISQPKSDQIKKLNTTVLEHFQTILILDMPAYSYGSEKFYCFWSDRKLCSLDVQRVSFKHIQQALSQR